MALCCVGGKARDAHAAGNTKPLSRVGRQILLEAGASAGRRLSNRHRHHRPLPTAKMDSGQNIAVYIRVRDNSEGKRVLTTNAGSGELKLHTPKEDRVFTFDFGGEDTAQEPSSTRSAGR